MESVVPLNVEILYESLLLGTGRPYSVDPCGLQRRSVGNLLVLGVYLRAILRIDQYVWADPPV